MIKKRREAKRGFISACFMLLSPDNRIGLFFCSCGSYGPLSGLARSSVPDPYRNPESMPGLWLLIGGCLSALDGYLSALNVPFCVCFSIWVG